jgi:Na+/proline symporter
VSRNAIIMTIFLVYLIGIWVYSVWTSRQVKNADDYLIAGRKVNLFNLIMHNIGTAIGGGDFFTFGALGFLWGVAGINFGLPWFVGTIIFSLLFVRRIKERADENTYSLASLFGQTWNSRAIELMVAAISFLLVVGYLAAQGSAMGKMFNVLTGMRYEIGVILGTVVFVTYVYLGGYVTTVKADVVQAIILLGGMLLMLGYGIFTVSTVPAKSLVQLPATHYTLFGAVPAMTLISLWTNRSMANGFLKPHVYQQIICAENAKTAINGIFWGNLVSFAGACTLVVSGLFVANIVPTLSDYEAAVPWFIQNKFAAVPAGLMLAAIFAAIMSSANSLLMTAVTLFSDSIYRRIINPKADDSQMKRFAKAAVVVIGVGAITIAYVLPSVVKIILTMSSWMPVLLPPLIATLWFDKKVDGRAVLAAIIIGFVAVFCFNVIPSWTKLTDGGSIPGLVVSIVVLLLASVIFRGSKQPNRPADQKGA